MDTGEDLFISGQLSIDSIIISNPEFPYQHFNIQENPDRTIISFGPSQQDYTISVGNNLSFDLIATQASEEKKCYTSITITEVSVTPYVFEANSDEFLKEWTVIVWVN